MGVMKTKDAIRSTSASGCFVLAMSLLLAAATPASAQVAPYGEKTMGDPAMDRLPDVPVSYTHLTLPTTERV